MAKPQIKSAAEQAAIVIFFIFAALALMMYLGKMPAILALPVLAVSLTIAAGTPYYLAQYPADMNYLLRLVHSISDSVSLAFSTVIGDGIGHPLRQVETHRLVLVVVRIAGAITKGVGDLRQAAEIRGQERG